MNETLVWLLTCSAGILLGGFFFGGLWWTVRKGVLSSQPAIWFLGSFLLRVGVVVTGFYFVSGRRWERLLACFVGFIVARVAVTWLTRPSRVPPTGTAPEAQHAP